MHYQALDAEGTEGRRGREGGGGMVTPRERLVESSRHHDFTSTGYLMKRKDRVDGVTTWLSGEGVRFHGFDSFGPPKVVRF